MFRRNLIPVWTAIILLSGMFLMGQSGECPWNEAVYIPDRYLKMAICSQVYQDPMYCLLMNPTFCPSDLEGITSLEAFGISNLTGLEYCTALTGLWIEGIEFLGQISNLSPLAGLTTLRSLGLVSNRISDLRPLEGLVNLEELGLGDNRISDLTPVAGLTALWFLHLSENQISNLTPLAGLTGLRELYLSSNQITGLGPLTGLTSLERLELNDNQISDLSLLAELAGLRNLGLDSNRISDLRPLAGLTGLEGLALNDNQISDLSPLEGLTNLSGLLLTVNQISDLRPLAGLTNLWWLALDDNQISDIYPLVENSGIGDEEGEWVSLIGNPLDETSCTVYIHELQIRGVLVYHDCPPCPCFDEDSDGYGDPGCETCSYLETDCDDSNPAVNPGAVEGPHGDPTCSDGLDNDCDGYADDDDVKCRPE